MKQNPDLFSCKLRRLEREYRRMQRHLALCQRGSPAQIRRARRRLKEAEENYDRLLAQSLAACRLPAAAALSQAQLDYRRRCRQILLTQLPEQLRQQDSAQTRAESAALYGEYAIDHAVDAMRHALLSALTAVELQRIADAHAKEETP